MRPRHRVTGGGTCAVAADRAFNAPSAPGHAPRSKVWETRGQPRLLVIGGYRMGFKVAERERGSQLTVFIDYQLPERGIERLLGRIFGSTYAAWCTRSMATDAVHAFPPGSTLPNGKAGKRP